MSSFDVLADGTSEGERMEAALDSRAFIAERDIENADALLAEAAKSDSGAFAELYERYYVRVYRYVFHRVGNETDAEDVTALVFMKALEALPSYRSGHGGFAPWVFRIARNAVVDYYRRARQHGQLEELHDRSDGTDPLAKALHNERRNELHMLVQHLSPDQREVVLMRYAADLSFFEIARTLKKNEPAVRMLLHRGLRKLKEVMTHES
jgi:RNA polymerase sigma factor (sigma-70 family)